ncbi:MAG: hypothetical protein KME64_17615 [Scytonematopsis contorta HA4267-MV1]|jgi:cytoskeletal protein RodZ|nr:hypothetical protein [Scytonematopsis contorta HA4267-MV1]
MTSTISQSAGNNAILFGSIGQVGTINILKLDSELGNKVMLSTSLESQQFPKPRPLPVLLPPRPFPLLLGRREEVKVAVDALPYDQSVEFYGSPGMGKSVILRYLAHHPSITPAFNDGIIYHQCVKHQSISDLLQILFNAFHDCGTSFKLTDIQIREALKNKKALVLLNNVKLTREEVQILINVLPSFTFLFASQERQLWGEGHPIKLGGLPLNDAVSLLTRDIGHPLNVEEHSAAEALCKALDGHPLQILQASALVKEENISLVVFAQQINTTASSSSGNERLLKSLTKAQRMILVLLAAFGANIALGAELIGDLTEIPQIKPILETLLRRNLVQVDEERFNIASSLVEELCQKENITAFMEKSVSYFTNWVQKNQGISGNLTSQSEAISEAIIKVLEWSFELSRFSDVITLGKSIEKGLALSGEWDRWNKVLQWVLEAARATGNQAIEAFALHQLGTRSLCLNEVIEAQSYLNQALHIRQLLNDQSGIEVTSHNLQFLLNPPLLPLLEPESESVSHVDENVADNKNHPLLMKLGVAALLLGLGGILLPVFLKPATLPPIETTPSNETPTPIETTPSNETPTPIETTPSNETPKPIETTPSNETPTPIETTPSNETPTPIETTPSNETPKPVETTPSNETPTPTVESKLISLVLEPNENVSKGTRIRGKVTIDNPAPADGITIKLTSSNKSIARVQEKVRILAGEVEANFGFVIPKESSDNPNDESVEISASYQEKVKTATITLLPQKTEEAELISLSLDKKLVGWGEKLVLTVTLSNPAPNDGIVINLESDKPYLAPVEASVKISAGEKQATSEFSTPKDGDNFPDGANIKITASYREVSKVESFQIIPYRRTGTSVLKPNATRRFITPYRLDLQKKPPKLN